MQSLVATNIPALNPKLLKMTKNFGNPTWLLMQGSKILRIWLKQLISGLEKSLLGEILHS